jgi:pimeloyl-ACP methyl ester carboxylesterase
VKRLSKVFVFIVVALVAGCANNDIDESKEVQSLPKKDLVDIHTGSGNFTIEGGKNYPNKNIIVFYHKPKDFNENSPVLMVIPGAGRNADDYRDSWVTSSEKYNVLIISPSYKEKDYDFAAYHLGGVVKNLKFNKAPRKEKYNNRIVFKIDNEDISFDANYDSDSFIFQDFDKIFDTTVKALGSHQKKYDIFGHSAGGQIAHRLAVFNPQTKVNRILASNSGSYTVPSFEEKLPFGTQDALLSKEHFKNAFQEKLVLFIGENDNEHETGGMLLHSPNVNIQGFHRFSRAQYFYKKSKEMASTLDLEFNWQLKIIPNIGHNYRLMGKAAASYLYE